MVMQIPQRGGLDIILRTEHNSEVRTGRDMVRVILEGEEELVEWVEERSVVIIIIIIMRAAQEVEEGWDLYPPTLLMRMV